MVLDHFSSHVFEVLLLIKSMCNVGDPEKKDRSSAVRMARMLEVVVWVQLRGRIWELEISELHKPFNDAADRMVFVSMIVGTKAVTIPLAGLLDPVSM